MDGKLLCVVVNLQQKKVNSILFIITSHFFINVNRRRTVSTIKMQRNATLSIPVSRFVMSNFAYFGITHEKPTDIHIIVLQILKCLTGITIVSGRCIER